MVDVRFQQWSCNVGLEVLRDFTVMSHLGVSGEASAALTLLLESLVA